MICPFPEKLWEMTAGELSELCEAAAEQKEERYRANEYLAFNTAALCLAAFNAPKMFPKSPKEAFGNLRGE